MSEISILDPPANADAAEFEAGFGPRVLLTIDTEEEFDWNAPFSRDGHTLKHIPKIAHFQSFCEGIGAHPVFLVDWPIANDAQAMEIIGGAAKSKSADLGMQLHPWVNPPFDEAVSDFNSYAGNLSPELEAAKFEQLHAKVIEATGISPLIYRAGRYGAGRATASILRNAGIAIDTSVRPLFDYTAQHGPDFSRHPAQAYWADRERSLLELPITSVYWGVLRELGRPLQALESKAPSLLGALANLGLLQRIALTPEGVTAEEAIRGIDIALDDGLDLIVLSFHSPTLEPGCTPYAKTQAQVDAIYDWFRTVYAYLDRRGVKSTNVAEILASVKK
ncbi:polysaccharide deacetylase family protein [Erythrobacter sp. YT30]|uniref:polysaccharide deacetylase family protein n=1 Tax=Erythrobacter sp. YT30 TaxID=1735012 RepID=UPI00076DA5B2|nr:polysaccharide deacetylase family protein [Erythrobacter sp. YT30]KWV92617.1 WalW protein [Erythrobacter sp. YT30]